VNARQKQLSGPLAEIEVLTKDYAAARSLLAERVTGLTEEIEALKKRRLPGIKAALASAAENQAQLRAAIEKAPAETFEKPRTHVFHGIKVGFRKGAGKVTFADAEQVLKLIRKHFADKADILIATTEKPNKEAISGLDVDELKKIGCAIEGTGDVVEIKPVDGEVDKIVTALLKEAADDEAAA
jgi:hypothetical protein